VASFFILWTAKGKKGGGIDVVHPLMHGS